MNSEKLKICHIITRMVIGGAQENTLFTCLDHVKKGHEVILVTGPSLGREGDLLSHLKISDKELKVVYNPNLVRELNPIKDLKAYFSLKNYLQKEKFDVVHTHASKAGIIGRIAARHAKVPFVVHTVHGQAFHINESFWKNLLYKFSEKIAASHCDKIFAVAQAMIDQCVEANIAPKDKYMVVYSGMEINNFLNAEFNTELAQKLEIPKNSIVIGSLARLFELKGYEYFIPAALELAQTHENLEFLIIGDGKMHDEIIDTISATPYARRFHFAGLIAPNEVYKYLSIIDVLWHFSVREGLPRSVVQALASGAVPMGFALDGTPEVIIDNQSGFLINYDKKFDINLKNIIEKSEILINSPDLRQKFQNFGRKLVADKFDHNYMSEILEHEYIEGVKNYS